MLTRPPARFRNSQTTIYSFKNNGKRAQQLFVDHEARATHGGYIISGFEGPLFKPARETTSFVRYEVGIGSRTSHSY